MRIKIQDTAAVHKRIFDLPQTERADAVRYELMRPYWRAWDAVGVPLKASRASGYDVISALRLGGMFRLDGPTEDYRVAIERLEQANTWQACGDALLRARESFREAKLAAPFPDELVFGILLGDPDSKALKANRGYTGYGPVPGYIHVVVWPTGYNIPRLPSVATHEFNHQVRMLFEPWSHDTTLAEYLVFEGLADSFAAHVCGSALSGPWVTDVDAGQLETAKALIAGALDTKGLENIQGYIFGDELAEQFGYAKVGLPHAAGYAVAYALVQDYLKETGKSPAEATLTPSAEILARSQFF